MKLIDKAVVVEEIKRYKHKADERLKIKGRTLAEDLKDSALQNLCGNLIHFLDTLEVKEVETWHLQEKEDIYDAVKGWSLHKFVCIMKNGTIQRFNGICDEDYEGHIYVHIEGINDAYDDVNDIVKWIEFT